MSYSRNQGESDARYGNVNRERASLDKDYARGVASVPGAVGKEYANIGADVGQSLGKGFEGSGSSVRDTGNDLSHSNAEPAGFPRWCALYPVMVIAGAIIGAMAASRSEDLVPYTIGGVIVAVVVMHLLAFIME